MTYGWTVFGAQLLDAFGYTADDREQVEAQLAGLLDELVSRLL